GSPHSFELRPTAHHDANAHADQQGSRRSFKSVAGHSAGHSRPVGPAQRTHPDSVRGGSASGYGPHGNQRFGKLPGNRRHCAMGRRIPREDGFTGGCRRAGVEKQSPQDLSCGFNQKLTQTYRPPGPPTVLMAVSELLMLSLGATTPS